MRLHLTRRRGGACAQEQDFSKVEIKSTQLAPHLYLLQGAGGNIAAAVGPEGVLLVDDEFAPLADKIRAALKGSAPTRRCASSSTRTITSTTPTATCRSRRPARW